MIDAEVFFNNVSTYNVSIFPMQIITVFYLCLVCINVSI
jgi:hypothetical protein